MPLVSRFLSSEEMFCGHLRCLYEGKLGGGCISTLFDLSVSKKII